MTDTAKLEDVCVVADVMLGADLVGLGEWPFDIAAIQDMSRVSFALRATTGDRQVLATTEISAELVASATTAQLSAFVTRALFDPARNLLVAYRAGEVAGRVARAADGAALEEASA